MALHRGFGRSGTINKNDFGKGPRTFYMKAGEETTVVLLDDAFVEVVRHCMFLKGDPKGNGLRETCYHFDPTNSAHAEDAPQHCLGCNGMLRHDRIARKHFIYLSLIDERQFEYEGKQYKDMKRLLELGREEGDVFERRRKSEGGLIGARFAVYRSRSQRSARHGSEWKFLGFVHNKQAGEDPKMGLMRYFWQSPGVPGMRESASKLEGKPIDHQEAVRRIIAPFDYEELMGTYNAQNMQRFVAYYEAATGTQGAASAGSGGSYVAPPMPGGMTPPPSMPAGMAPATSHFQQHGSSEADVPPWEQQSAPAPVPATVPAPQPQMPAAAPYQVPAFPGGPHPSAGPAPHQPYVPDPVQAGGAAYSPPPFPGQVIPPSQQFQQPQSAQGAPLGASYEFGGVPGQQRQQQQPPQRADDFGLS